jgi:transposase
MVLESFYEAEQLISNLSRHLVTQEHRDARFAKAARLRKQGISIRVVVQSVDVERKTVGRRLCARRAPTWRHYDRSTKMHIRAEGLGKPVPFTLKGGKIHDSKAFATLVRIGWIKRLGRGSPRFTSVRLAANKGCSSGVIRSIPRRRGIQPVIPTKSNERPDLTSDGHAYRERNRVEWLIHQLKRFRQIATKDDKCTANYLGMITIAAILRWI